MPSRNMGLSKGFIWRVDASCDVIRGEEAVMTLYQMSSTGNPNLSPNPNDSPTPNFNIELLILGFV